MRLFCSLFLLSLPLHAVDLTFPKLGDAKRIPGELVCVDFVHRSGQFRTEKGELMDFTMPPYAIMKHRGAESDLRDVPLGSNMDFLMLPGSKLLTTDDGQKPDPEQQKRFREFTEKRGVAGWITKTEAKTVTVQLFSGDPAFYESAFGELLVKGKETKLCVANDELRTWNPGVDGERGSILDVQKMPTDHFGNSGYQIIVSVSNMLEGFRRGRVVRIFLAGWKVQDQFYGESLMGYGYGRMQNHELVENVAKEYPEQFPFRTDFSNAQLPWYQFKDGVKPPEFSEHVVYGELVQMDAETDSGKFLTERTGKPVNFTLVKKHTLKHLGADPPFNKLPIGQRYRFHLYQDDQGSFTRVSLISDDFSHLSANATTARITAIHSDKLHAAWMLPLVKDYNGDMQRPQDFGRCILGVSDKTRVWKDDKQVHLGDLKTDDVILFNRTAELPGKLAQCTDIWVGEDTHKRVTEERKAALKKKP